MFLQTFVNEFLAAPLLIQVFVVFSLVFPIVALVVYFVSGDRLDKAVDKYGETVRRYKSEIVNQYLRKKGGLN